MKLTLRQRKLFREVEKTKRIIQEHEVIVKEGKLYLEKLKEKQKEVIEKMIALLGEEKK